ncbi:MAG: KleE stable inheritance protein [Pseudomonadota bacterium]
MGTVIKFPQKAIERPPAATPVRSAAVQGCNMPVQLRSLTNRVIRGIHLVLWTLIVLLLPLLKFVLGLDLLFQFGRMLYYWQTPGMHAGITCMLHFLGAVGLVVFILKQPRGT